MLHCMQISSAEYVLRENSDGRSMRLCWAYGRFSRKPIHSKNYNRVFASRKGIQTLLGVVWWYNNFEGSHKLAIGFVGVPCFLSHSQDPSAVGEVFYCWIETFISPLWTRKFLSYTTLQNTTVANYGTYEMFYVCIPYIWDHKLQQACYVTISF